MLRPRKSTPSMETKSPALNGFDDKTTAECRVRGGLVDLNELTVAADTG